MCSFHQLKHRKVPTAPIHFLHEVGPSFPTWQEMAWVMGGSA